LSVSSLKTALRDAVLIVVSILIAFALDAWWDGQSKAAEEREALTALKAELAASRAELDSVMAFNVRQIKRVDRYLDGRFNAEADGEVLDVFSGGLTFDPSIGAIEAILAGGLDRVTSLELRAAIAAWPGVLREIDVDQWIMVDRYNALQDVLVTQGFYLDVMKARRNSQAMSRTMWMRLAADPLVRQRVAALGGGIGGLMFELADVEARLADLEGLVEGELGNR
jgi:hypothetical protein